MGYFNKLAITVFLISILSLESKAQSFWSLEGSAGKIVPNYPGHPTTNIRADMVATYYTSSDSTYWGSYFRNPELGISLRACYLGNLEILGNQLSIYPNINFRLSEKENPFYLKFGIGLAMFNKPFDSIDNPQNQVMGSHLSWHFNLALSKPILIKPKIEYRITASYVHASNGHMTIPNYGMNAAMIGLEVLFRTKKEWTPIFIKDSHNSYWVIEQRTGIGMHKLAGTTAPLGTPDFGVYNFGFNLGYVHREHLKFKTGLYGRYYNSYYNYLVQNGRNPAISDASSLYLMIGTELLMGHFGLDAELGVNVYRPFFREFYDKFVDRSPTDYFLKNLISNRLGLNYYLFNCYSHRKLNIRLGAHINANFGQADFSDVSLGFVYKLSNSNY